MLDSIACYLRGRIHGRLSVERVNLHGYSEMSSLSPDDVVLITRGVQGSTELGVGDQSSVKSLPLIDNGPVQCERPGLIERTPGQGHMVPPGELPVQLPGEG